MLKNRYTERDDFYLKRDNSLEEIWDAFMLMKKANSGDPVAQHELGLRYLTGKDFEADTQKAALWIGKAAKQNLLPAKYNYGILRNNGWGVEWDPFEAYHDFQYAALNGMTEAKYAYGLLLTDDLTVNRNFSEAYRWISAAADSGYEPASEVLEEFRARGIKFSGGDEKSPGDSVRSNIDENSKPPYQAILPSAQPVFIDFDSKPPNIPDTKKLMLDLFDAASFKMDSSNRIIRSAIGDTNPDPETIRSIYNSAENGTPEALILIGRLYERGIGVARDPYLSSLFFVRAARTGYPWAPLLLWEVTRSEDFFPILKKEMEANDPAAYFIWAQLNRYGIDHQLTEIQAIEFLNKAATMDFTDAMIELGLHYYGIGKDKERGIMLLKRAAELGNSEAKIRLYMIELMSDDRSRQDSVRFGFISEAAGKGSVLAEMLIGYCYEKGIDVEINTSQAVRFYRKASGRGSNIAYEALRDMYDKKRPAAMEFQIRN